MISLIKLCYLPNTEDTPNYHILKLMVPFVHSLGSLYICIFIPRYFSKFRAFILGVIVDLIKYSFTSKNCQPSWSSTPFFAFKPEPSKPILTQITCRHGSKSVTLLDSQPCFFGLILKHRGGDIVVSRDDPEILKLKKVVSCETKRNYAIGYRISQYGLMEPKMRLISVINSGLKQSKLI